MLHYKVKDKYSLVLAFGLLFVSLGLAEFALTGDSIVYSKLAQAIGFLLYIPDTCFRSTNETRRSNLWSSGLTATEVIKWIGVVSIVLSLFL